VSKRYILPQSALAFVLAFALTAGCGAADGDSSAENNGSRGGGGVAAQTPNERGGGQANGQNGREGGRGRGGRNMTITLAATDLVAVRRGSVEDALPVTGNLQPLERVEVRARLEGELLSVHVREGESVRPGQVLARFEASEEESAQRSAEADVTAARTELSTATWNLEQTRELFKEGAVPERDVKTGEQQVASARARLAAAESRLRTANQALQDTRVLAPAAAVIERRLTSNGEHVNRGASLFTLVRTHTLELTGAVPARVGNRVRPGQTVRFMADGREFRGRVARVSPTIDPASRSVSVYIQIPNADGALKGGTFASGRIVSRVAEDALIIPTNAIRQAQQAGESYVYRIDGENIERRPIHLGLVDETGGIAEVTDGLAEGDRVVTAAVSTSARTARVTIIGGEGRRGPAPIPRN
jgi:membrane fusion protein, multidrug efflux system